MVREPAVLIETYASGPSQLIQEKLLNLECTQCPAVDSEIVDLPVQIRIGGGLRTPHPVLRGVSEAVGSQGRGRILPNLTPIHVKDARRIASSKRQRDADVLPIARRQRGRVDDLFIGISTRRDPEPQSTGGA